MKVSGDALKRYQSNIKVLNLSIKFFFRIPMIKAATRILAFNWMKSCFQGGLSEGLVEGPEVKAIPALIVWSVVSVGRATGGFVFAWGMGQVTPEILIFEISSIILSRHGSRAPDRHHCTNISSR